MKFRQIFTLFTSAISLFIVASCSDDDSVRPGASLMPPNDLTMVLINDSTTSTPNIYLEKCYVGYDYFYSYYLSGFIANKIRYFGNHIVDSTMYIYDTMQLQEKTIVPVAYVKWRDRTYNVTKLSSLAFSNNKFITMVNLPVTLKVLDNDAFFRCENLQYVQMPEGLEVIGSNAFAYCEKLTSITIPSTVQDIGLEIFKGSGNITDVYTASKCCSHQSFGVYVQHRATLHVPKGELEWYRTHTPWSSMENIVDDYNP